MKTKLQFSMMLMAISLSLTAQNLVTNGDFQTGDNTGWLYTIAGSTISTTTTLNSTYVFEYTDTPVNHLTVASYLISNPSPGSTYSISMDSNVDVILNILNNSTNDGDYGMWLASGVTQDFVFPADGSDVRIEFRKNKWAATLQIDNISVIPAAPLGINEVEALKANIYPNPVSDVLNISASEELVSYTVFNVIGQKIKEGELSSSISVSDLAKGVFFVKTKGASGQVYTAKFIVK